MTALLATVAGFLDGVLRGAALGALLGQALALRAQRRSLGHDAFAQVAKWTLVGAAAGAALGWRRAYDQAGESQRTRFLLIFVVSVTIGLAGKHAGFGYYPQLALCFLAAFAITQLDREHFYGPR